MTPPITHAGMAASSHTDPRTTDPLDHDPLTTATWATAIAAPLLHGLSHALSNRVGALDALVELALDPELPLAERSAHAALVRSEVARLRHLNDQYTLIVPDQPGREPIHAADAVSLASQLSEYHRDRPDVTFALEVHGRAPALLVSRWTLVHALVAVIDAVYRRSGVSALRVTLSGDEAAAEIRVGPNPVATNTAARAGSPVFAPRRADEGEVPSLSVAIRLAATFAGTITEEPDGVVCLRLPSLATLRQRERRGQPGGRRAT